MVTSGLRQIYLDNFQYFVVYLFKLLDFLFTLALIFVFSLGWMMFTLVKNGALFASFTIFGLGV